MTAPWTVSYLKALCHMQDSRRVLEWSCLFLFPGDLPKSGIGVSSIFCTGFFHTSTTWQAKDSKFNYFCLKFWESMAVYFHLLLILSKVFCSNVILLLVYITTLHVVHFLFTGRKLEELVVKPH